MSEVNPLLDDPRILNVLFHPRPARAGSSHFRGARDGSVALVRLAFGDDIEPLRLEYLKQRYLEIYQHNLANESCLFDDMDTVFEEFHRRGIRWGVVTNKPGWLTLPLMHMLGLHDAAACIVQQRLGNADPLPIAFRQVADQPPADVVEIAAAFCLCRRGIR